MPWDILKCIIFVQYRLRIINLNPIASKLEEKARSKTLATVGPLSFEPNYSSRVHGYFAFNAIPFEFAPQSFAVGYFELPRTISN